MTKLHTYGIIFWNEGTDEEVCAYFEAESHWHAQQIAEPYQIDGFIKGGVLYIENKDKSYYNQPLESVAHKSKSDA